MKRNTNANKTPIIRIIALAFLPILFLALSAPAAEFGYTPTLKWKLGGCYASWCETGWYSSPAVADLDGDGEKEVIAAAYSIFLIDGSSGLSENTAIRYLRKSATYFVLIGGAEGLE